LLTSFADVRVLLPWVIYGSPLLKVGRKTLPERVCLHRGLATSFSKLGGQLRGFTILVLTRILGKKNYMIC